jgi:CCR4-NOT transcription complex subunit 9
MTDFHLQRWFLPTEFVMFSHFYNQLLNILTLVLFFSTVSFFSVNSSSAHIPLFLYPFLNTVSPKIPYEYLRLTSLGVIGALVKTDDQDVIKFLLSTEIIPLCLRIMETGGDLSQTV